MDARWHRLPTHPKEAEDYVQYVVDHADWGRWDIWLICRRVMPAPGPTLRGCYGAAGRDQIERRALARGSYCAIGDPDAVAQELSRLHSAGFDGLALNFVDYLAELPYFAAAVLPRLERLGLRPTTTR